MDAKLQKLRNAINVNRTWRIGFLILLVVIIIGLVFLLTKDGSKKTRLQNNLQSKNTQNSYPTPTPTAKPKIPDAKEIQETIQFRIPEGWQKIVDPHNLSYVHNIYLESPGYPEDQSSPVIVLEKHYLEERPQYKTIVKDVLEGKPPYHEKDSKLLKIDGHDAVTFNSWNFRDNLQVFLIQLEDSYWQIVFGKIVPENANYEEYPLVVDFLNSLHFRYRKQVQDLRTAWETGAAVYKNFRLPFSFRYPSFFVINELDKQDVDWKSKYPERDENLHEEFYVSFSTPDVLDEERHKPRFDTLFYRKNTMWFRIEVFDNSEDLSLDDFLKRYYRNPGIDGKTFVYDLMEPDLRASNIPLNGSFIMEGFGGGENLNKAYLFSYKGKVYQMTMSRGIDTGEQYSEEAEKIFDEVIRSIKFN